MLGIFNRNPNIASSSFFTLYLYFITFRTAVISLFSLNIDGVGTILPLAALLTGAFLTLGVGVILVVILAIRKRRNPAARSICDDKDKHLGELLIYFLEFVVVIFG